MRIFTLEDQLAFADLSGDCNPVHVDTIAARRLILGEPVIHGVHAFLWALNEYLAEQKSPLTLQKLQVLFLKPMLLGKPIDCSFQVSQSNNVEIEIYSDKVLVTKILIEKEDVQDLSSQQQSDYLKPHLPEKRFPRVVESCQIESESGDLDLHFNLTAATKLFPDLCLYLSPLQISVILATTRLVGVICPGLNSIFSELNLITTNSLNDVSSLRYQVSKYDQRFGLVSMNIDAPGMTGSINAFLRPSPQAQPSYLELKNLVCQNEFSGQKAFILGGSRGLGEVAAKLLAGGGADVKITYNKGEDEAKRIVDDIVSHGGLADCLRVDVLQLDSDARIFLNDWAPSHFYFFATPFIASGIKGQFSTELFNKFCNYYLSGFSNAVNQVMAMGTKHIFYPSTVFIDERPANLCEYTIAKSAGERLCQFFTKTHPGVTIYKPRLPKMATDQTASMMPVNNQDPGPKMLTELQTFRDLSSASSEEC